MEKLLVAVFSRCVARGALTVETARGKKLMFGDGTGEEVRIRFDGRRCRAGACTQSRAVRRRAFHGRPLGRRARHDLRFPRACAARSCAALAPHAPAQECAHAEAPLHEPEQSLARAPQRRAPLRSRPPALQPLPRQGLAVQLRLLRAARRDAGGGPARQEAACHGKARARARQPRPRHRLRLGRARALHQGDRRRRGRAGHHACRPSSSTSPPSARASAGCKTRCASRCRTTAT